MTTSLFIGFNAYAGHQQVYESIPSLVGVIPEEVQDGDLIVTLEHRDSEQIYCAGQTAVDVEQHTRPIEGDEYWVQLVMAALVQTGQEQIQQLSLALPIHIYDDWKRLHERLFKESWTIQTEGHQTRVDLQHLKAYPAITAGLYDLHLAINQGELVKRQEEPLEGLNVLLVMVGHHETEWLLTRNLQPIKGGKFYCGICTLQVEIKDEYYYRSGFSLLPEDADTAVHTGEIRIEDHYVEIGKIIQLGQKNLGLALIREIQQVCQEQVVDKTFLTGEGMLHVDPSLRDQMTEQGIRVVNEPHFAVLRGLDVLDRLMESKYE